jgi:hypothetical protein
LGRGLLRQRRVVLCLALREIRRCPGQLRRMPLVRFPVRCDGGCQLLLERGAGHLRLLESSLELCLALRSVLSGGLPLGRGATFDLLLGRECLGELALERLAGRGGLSERRVVL